MGCIVKKRNAETGVRLKIEIIYNNVLSAFLQDTYDVISLFCLIKFT